MSRKEYDFEKAKSIIEELKEDIETADIGMKEDWWWTAELVFENGKYNISLNSVKEIAGINGSDWATPILRIYFKNGGQEEFEVFKEDDE